MTLKKLPFDLSFSLLDQHECILLSFEPVCKGVCDVGFLERQIIVQEVIYHAELQIFLQLLERVRILGLFVHQMADEMIVGLIQIAEV